MLFQDYYKKNFFFSLIHVIIFKNRGDSMNGMDPHFHVDYNKAKSKPEATFQGSHYRITVLTERLVRLEYNKDGLFFDDLTEQVINRNFALPKFKVVQDDKYLEITTDYFLLKYQKEKPMESLNIEIDLLNTDKRWDIKNKEVRNFKTSGLGIDLTKPDYQKGLYSVDGFVTIDDSPSMILNQDGFLTPNNTPRVDIYVFMYRRDFGLCLKDYFELTGYPALLPRYALGIWWNKSDIYNFNDISELLQNFNRHEIPLSVLLLDEFWHLKDGSDLTKYKTGYTFNRNLFSDPAHFTNYLHERGVKLGLQIDPKEGIMPHEDAYESIANSLGLMDRSTIPFNVFDKFIVNSYLHQLILPLEQKGVDFFWLDLDNKDLPSMRALTRYQFENYKRNDGQRGLILGRNGLVAAHRYPVLYSGHTLVSWDTLKVLPYYNSMAANKGLSWWSHDIGGYMGGMEESELYLRYIQLGCFSPIFRLSSKGGKYYKREPWKWDVKTLKIVKDYMVLRHRFIPYLYTEGYKYHKAGLPVIQPLYYTSPALYDEPEHKNEYYFGSELLVSPITTEKDVLMNRTVHRVYLPAGTWYDFKTGKRFNGDKRYVTFYKDEDYPVFAKKGAIIPLADLKENKNDTSSPDSMEIHIFPGKSNIYNLYEDDGISRLYEKGFYITTAIDYNYLQNNFTVIIRPTEGKSGIIPELRNYKIRFRNTRKADEVIVYLDANLYECNSYVEDTDFIVEAKNVPTTSQLSINCKGKDIEIDAVRLINEDIDSIISDLKIKTTLKEMLAEIVFSNLDIKKKRIAIKKLKSNGLDSKFISMFMKLLEYIEEI